MWNWDDFQNQLIYITKVDLYTVALAMRNKCIRTIVDIRYILLGGASMNMNSFWWYVEKD